MDSHNRGMCIWAFVGKPISRQAISQAAAQASRPPKHTPVKVRSNSDRPTLQSHRATGHPTCPPTPTCCHPLRPHTAAPCPPAPLPRAPPEAPPLPPLHTPPHLLLLTQVEPLHGHPPLHRAQRIALAIGEAADAARLVLQRRLPPLLRRPALQPAGGGGKERRGRRMGGREAVV